MAYVAHGRFTPVNGCLFSLRGGTCHCCVTVAMRDGGFCPANVQSYHVRYAGFAIHS
jgi:hypothetical protein